ncbi:MAG: N-acetyltransferase [Vicinamibacterales bacterium]
MIEIRPARTRRDIRRFIDYMYERNAADPHWVPPLWLGERDRLNPKKNPFFAHADAELLLAWRGDRVVGRVAAIDDRLHEAAHHDNLAMFGFFEADDAESARALLTAVESWATARGRAHVRGPISPAMNDTCGLLVDGFDTDSMLLMPHNPPEYGAFIEQAGYAKVKDLYAWLYELRGELPPVVARLAERLRQKLQITLRPINLAEFTREADRLREIYISAWERNWGFVPPTPEEFRHIAKEMKPIFDPRCAVVAEAGGRLVACAIALPDINQALKGTGGKLFPLGLVKLLRRKRYIDQARLLLLGVDPAYRTTGLYPLLIAELHRQSQGGPYARAEFSWILEDNRDINQPAEQAGARRYKTYRIYQKNLAPGRS